MNPLVTHALATNLLDRCRTANITIVTAESCTGGLLAAALTEIAGSSAVVDRGFVTYSNAAKRETLGVPLDLIERVGAVSEEVARAMAEGAARVSKCGLAISITGIAGPGGGTPEKPVGLVYIAVVRPSAATKVARKIYAGDRHAVRGEAVAEALRLGLAALADNVS